MRTRQFLLSLCLFAIATFAKAAPIDVSQIDSAGIEIMKHLQYFRNVKNEQFRTQINALPQDSFRVFTQRDDSEFINNKNGWFKFDLVNSSDRSITVLFRYQALHNINFYFRDGEEYILKDSFLSSRKYSLFGASNRFMPIEVLPSDTQSVFLHKTMYGKFGLQFKGTIDNFLIGQQKNFIEIQKRYTENLHRVVFLSIVLAFALFTVLQYFQHKDRSYLFYSFYLQIIFTVFLWRDSLWFETPFSPWLHDYWELLYAPVHYFVLLAYVLFFRSFLNDNQSQGEAEEVISESKQGGIHKLLTYSIYMILLFLVLDFLMISMGFVKQAREVYSYGVIFMMSGFAILLWKIYQFSSGAIRYLFWGVVCLFIVASMELWVKENQNAWPFYIDPIRLGLILEIMFFGLALSHRTKILQEEKQTALREKKIEAEKSRLFLQLTHDFRSPLTIIKINADLILLHYKQAAKQINDINFSVDRLTARLDSLLKLSKIQAGNNKPELYNGDIAKHLKSLVTYYRSLAVEQGITLSFSANPVSWEIAFSPNALQYIIENLISNALKFTPQYGTVEVRLRKEDKLIIIEVEDSGKGINKEEAEKVFDRFYQVKIKGENSVGSGLGLTIVQQWTEVLGGWVTVESEVGKGTTFSVSLPATNTENILPDEMHLYSEFDRPSKRDNEDSPSLGLAAKILLVEDDYRLRKTLKKLLEFHYHVLTAENGKLGLKTAIEEQPDIIISDEIMPVMRGFEMLEELKQTPETEHIPVIILTAKSGRKDELQALSLKVDAYLSKPPDTEKLLLKLRNLLEKQKRLKNTSDVVRWKGKIVTDLFMKDTLAVLEKNHMRKKFPAYRLKIALDKRGYGNEKKVDSLLKTHFETTAGKLIKSYRLEKARSLVRNKRTISLVEISEQVGLDSDAAYFSKIYKAEFGILPSEDRKRL